MTFMNTVKWGVKRLWGVNRFNFFFEFKGSQGSNKTT